MQIPKRKIEKSLLTKGFIMDENDHRYFYHEYNGKRTGTYAYTSHGSKYKDYGITLIKLIKRQLMLNNIKDTIDLLKCPMGSQEYINILKAKSIIPK